MGISIIIPPILLIENAIVNSKPPYLRSSDLLEEAGGPARKGQGAGPTYPDAKAA
jgi:hypothetical protein